MTNPLPSLLYGIGVFLLSTLVVWGLYRLEFDYFLFPALAGFMVIGPLIANGLYEKSRRLEAGEPAPHFDALRADAVGPSGVLHGALLLGLSCSGCARRCFSMRSSSA